MSPSKTIAKTTAPSSSPRAFSRTCSWVSPRHQRETSGSAPSSTIPGTSSSARGRSATRSPRNSMTSPVAHSPTTLRRDEEAARRPARRTGPRGEPRAGAGARAGGARARGTTSRAIRCRGRRARGEGAAAVRLARRREARERPRAARRSSSTGRDAIDVGASTGGFTDCLLQHGVARVIAVDVGYGQLHPKLRDDPRVTVLERTNARELTELPFRPDLLVADVSFISVRIALPPVLRLLDARLGRGRARQAAVRGRDGRGRPRRRRQRPGAPPPRPPRGRGGRPRVGWRRRSAS